MSEIVIGILTDAGERLATKLNAAEARARTLRDALDELFELKNVLMQADHAAVLEPDEKAAAPAGTGTTAGNGEKAEEPNPISSIPQTATKRKHTGRVAINIPLVQDRMTALQLTRQGLADQMYYTIPTVRHWLSGETLPAPEDVVTLAGILGVGVGELTAADGVVEEEES